VDLRWVFLVVVCSECQSYIVMFIVKFIERMTRMVANYDVYEPLLWDESLKKLNVRSSACN